MEGLRKSPFDWSVNPRVQVEMSDHASLETQVCITIGPDLMLSLRTELERVLRTSESELRLTLPGNWTLYWKARSGESRVLLAHPDKDQWVATIAWSESQVETLLQAMVLEGAAGSVSEVVLSQYARLQFPSNLEVLLRVRH